jgi:hypothetical protein
MLKDYTPSSIQETLTEIEGFVMRSNMPGGQSRTNAIWRIPIADREDSPSGSEIYHRATARSGVQHKEIVGDAGC